MSNPEILECVEGEEGLVSDVAPEQDLTPQLSTASDIRAEQDGFSHSHSRPTQEPGRQGGYKGIARFGASTPWCEQITGDNNYSVKGGDVLRIQHNDGGYSVIGKIQGVTEHGVMVTFDPHNSHLVDGQYQESGVYTLADFSQIVRAEGWDLARPVTNHPFSFTKVKTVGEEKAAQRDAETEKQQAIASQEKLTERMKDPLERSEIALERHIESLKEKKKGLEQEYKQWEKTAGHKWYWSDVLRSQGDDGMYGGEPRGHVPTKAETQRADWHRRIQDVEQEIQEAEDALGWVEQRGIENESREFSIELRHLMDAGKATTLTGHLDVKIRAVREFKTVGDHESALAVTGGGLTAYGMVMIEGVGSVLFTEDKKPSIIAKLNHAIQRGHLESDRLIYTSDDLRALLNSYNFETHLRHYNALVAREHNLKGIGTEPLPEFTPQELLSELDRLQVIEASVPDLSARAHELQSQALELQNILGRERTWKVLTGFVGGVIDLVDDPTTAGMVAAGAVAGMVSKTIYAEALASGIGALSATAIELAAAGIVFQTAANVLNYTADPHLVDWTPQAYLHSIGVFGFLKGVGIAGQAISRQTIQHLAKNHQYLCHILQNTFSFGSEVAGFTALNEIQKSMGEDYHFTWEGLTKEILSSTQMVLAFKAFHIAQGKPNHEGRYEKACGVSGRRIELARERFEIEGSPENAEALHREMVTLNQIQLLATREMQEQVEARNQRGGYETEEHYQAALREVEGKRLVIEGFGRALNDKWQERSAGVDHGDVQQEIATRHREAVQNMEGRLGELRRQRIQIGRGRSRDQGQYQAEVRLIQREMEAVQGHLGHLHRVGELINAKTFTDASRAEQEAREHMASTGCEATVFAGKDINGRPVYRVARGSELNTPSDYFGAGPAGESYASIHEIFGRPIAHTHRGSPVPSEADLLQLAATARLTGKPIGHRILGTVQGRPVALGIDVEVGPRGDVRISFLDSDVMALSPVQRQGLERLARAVEEKVAGTTSRQALTDLASQQLHNADKRGGESLAQAVEKVNSRISSARYRTVLVENEVTKDKSTFDREREYLEVLQLELRECKDWATLESMNRELDGVFEKINATVGITLGAGSDSGFTRLVVPKEKMHSKGLFTAHPHFVGAVLETVIYEVGLGKRVVLEDSGGQVYLEINSTEHKVMADVRNSQNMRLVAEAMNKTFRAQPNQKWDLHLKTNGSSLLPESLTDLVSQHAKGKGPIGTLEEKLPDGSSVVYDPQSGSVVNGTRTTMGWNYLREFSVNKLSLGLGISEQEAREFIEAAAAEMKLSVEETDYRAFTGQDKSAPQTWAKQWQDTVNALVSHGGVTVGGGQKQFHMKDILQIIRNFSSREGGLNERHYQDNCAELMRLMTKPDAVRESVLRELINLSGMGPQGGEVRGAVVGLVYNVVNHKGGADFEIEVVKSFRRVLKEGEAVVVNPESRNRRDGKTPDLRLETVNRAAVMVELKTVRARAPEIENIGRFVENVRRAYDHGGGEGSQSIAEQLGKGLKQLTKANREISQGSVGGVLQMRVSGTQNTHEQTAIANAIKESLDALGLNNIHVVVKFAGTESRSVRIERNKNAGGAQVVWYNKTANTSPENFLYNIPVYP